MNMTLNPTTQIHFAEDHSFLCELPRHYEDWKVNKLLARDVVQNTFAITMRAYEQRPLSSMMFCARPHMNSSRMLSMAITAYTLDVSKMIAYEDSEMTDRDRDVVKAMRGGEQLINAYRAWFERHEVWFTARVDDKHKLHVEFFFDVMPAYASRFVVDLLSPIVPLQ